MLFKVEFPFILAVVLEGVNEDKVGMTGGKHPFAIGEDIDLFSTMLIWFGKG